MTGLVFFAAFLLLPLFGFAVWRLPAAARLTTGARLAVAGAAGALVTAIALAFLSLWGIGWTTTRLILAFVAIGAFNWRLLSRGETVAPARLPWRWPSIGVAIFILLTAYGVFTARESCGDLHYFWGPKAVRFYRSGGIDPAFLRSSDAHSLNPDYPPLVPLIYVMSETLARHFSWWAALALLPLTLLAIAAMIRSFSGDDAGTLLTIAVLSHAIAVGFAAGGGEPALLLFETLTLCAITFVDDERSQTILAAIGLAGAVWTKVEGATFMVAVVVTLLILRRRPRQVALMALPATILLACWIRFTQFGGFLTTYDAGSRYPFKLAFLKTVIPLVVRAASFEIFWLPWLAMIAVIISGNVRRALVPLGIAILTLGAAVFFYSRIDDPGWWIAASAPRVLLTPLLALGIAATRATTAES
jgi:hypothetical protein